MTRVSRNMRTIVGLVVILGCGGSGSEPAEPTPGPSRPTITSFSATPTRITSDQTTTLTWSITGAQTVTIDNGVGAVTGNSTTVSPGASTTYTLSATNSAGTSTATAAVTVTAGVAGITLTWNAASSVKLEQVIGDKDWAAAARGITLPTASLTSSRYGVFGTDIGSSFEASGKVVFLFGDTRAENPNVNLGAVDPIGFSTTTDGDSPLQLNFFTQSNGTTLWITPPGIKMAGDDVPNAGIALSDGIYFVVNTGADHTLGNDYYRNAYSVLVRFDETAKTFTTGRTISRSADGHFVFTGLRASGADVYMFGTGKYRASDIFLSQTPASGFWAGTGTRYFAGRVNGQPTWTTSEAAAVPVIQDNPLNGPPWPNDNPSVGNLSVSYSPDLGMWLMTFDGGRQSATTRGIYFTYAKDPWGPWATPQLIFNGVRDNALGVFIHNPGAVPSDGLTGPTIGPNDPVTTAGAAYAPSLIERFTRVTGTTLRIYYLLSTWNPYTVVKMRSEFSITRP